MEIGWTFFLCREFSSSKISVFAYYFNFEVGILNFTLNREDSNSFIIFYIVSFIFLGTKKYYIKKIIVLFYLFIYLFIWGKKTK